MPRLPRTSTNKNARKCCTCHAKELKIIQTAGPATKSNFTGLWRQNDFEPILTCFRLAKTSRLYDRANEYGAGAKKTITRLPSRTPQSDHPWIASPTGTATRTRRLPKNRACAAKPHVELEKLRFAHGANENSTSQVIKLTRSALPRWESHSAIILADGCGPLRTVAQHPANKSSPPDPQDETRTLCYAFGNKKELNKKKKKKKNRETKQREQQITTRGTAPTAVKPNKRCGFYPKLRRCTAEKENKKRTALAPWMDEAPRWRRPGRSAGPSRPWSSWRPGPWCLEAEAWGLVWGGGRGVGGLFGG